MKFEVYDNDDDGQAELIGAVETTLPIIIASKHLKFKDKLINENGKLSKQPLGWLVVKAEPQSDSNNDITI